jgi:LacI family transcriptional regulator
MYREVTIYDIAESLGLSAATVSRALKDHPAIHEKTKGRVRRKADEMGYRFNAFASNLRRKKTNTLGVIVPRLNSTFMSSVLAGMERVASEAGYNLLIAQSLESTQKEAANVVTMFNSRVDGLLVSLAYDTTDYLHFDKFISRGIPVLFFDRVPEQAGNRVVIDNFGAGRDVTRHLIENGCRRIFHVTGNLKRNVYLERYEGYLCALKEAGLPFTDEMLIVQDLSEASGKSVATHIHQSTDKPDGVFIANDLCAVSFIKTIKELGYRVPQDIAVVGFNNDPVSQFIEPQLTTVCYSGEQVGETALRELLSTLKGNAPLKDALNVVLPHRVIVRGSSRRNQPTETSNSF